jgi:hypothetical protein
MTEISPANTRAQLQRTRILRRAAGVLIATIALVFIMMLLRDQRQRGVAVALADQYARVLTEDRLPASGKVPLLLQPNDELAPSATRFGMKWLAADEARRLRDFEAEVILAHTRHVPMWLHADGFAVVIHRDGAIVGTWMTEPEFTDRQNAQEAFLQARAEAAPPLP